MKFTETPVHGVWLVEPERHEDNRGFFARTWCAREFEQRGLDHRLVQCNVSYNRQRGTVRGMHFQKSPCEEAKLVRCTAGAVWDVVVDLRSDSETYLQHLAVQLDPVDHIAVYIPKGCAHGFQTLEDSTELLYQMTEYFSPDAASGVRWNDPLINVQWPIDVSVIAERDLQFPDFTTGKGIL
ncbi:MAG: dTDP-4-dehydrorhamnose 3,5-epimerase [Planctomycetaceae bacterium]